MSDNVQTAMFEILKKIQADIADMKPRLAKIEEDVADVKPRLARVEKIVLEQRTNGAAVLVMMRATVGAFDKRLIDVEEDVREILAREQASAT
jgi:hypothetical protein